jgi:hypothetical protein
VRFGNREIDAANAFKNALGTYPAMWRVPITFRRDGQEFERRVRLAGMHREGELEALLQAEHEPPVPNRPKDSEEPKPGEPKTPRVPGPEKEPAPNDDKRGGRKGKSERIPRAVRQHFEEAPGYANYWFNRYHQQRVWNAFLARGDFAEAGWNWNVAANTATGGDALIELTEKAGTITMPDGKSGAKFGLSLVEEQSPPRSGGLLTALHLWQRLLLFGPRRFGEVYYLGKLPWTNEEKLVDCLVATHGGVETRFLFDTESADLIGIEMQAADDEDPCEIYFSDYREVDGRYLPHQWTVRHGDEVFTELKVSSYSFAPTDTANSK